MITSFLLSIEIDNNTPSYRTCPERLLILQLWKDELSKGSVAHTIDWLKENVHFKANLYDPSEMLESITGMKLTAQPFI